MRCCCQNAGKEQAETRGALSCLSLTCTSTGTSSAAACSSATRSSGAQAEARTTEPRRQGGQEDEADAGCPHEEGAERGASLACLPACPVPTHGTASSSPQVPLAQKKKTEQRLAAEAARGAEVKAWVKAKLRKRKHALPEVIFFTKHLGLQVGATAATVEWVVDFLLRDSSKLQGVHVLVLSEVEWSDRSKAALARFISACPVLCVLDARGSGCQLQSEHIKDRESGIFIVFPAIPPEGDYDAIRFMRPNLLTSEDVAACRYMEGEDEESLAAAYRLVPSHDPSTDIRKALLQHGLLREDHTVFCAEQNPAKAFEPWNVADLKYLHQQLEDLNEPIAPVLPRQTRARK